MSDETLIKVSFNMQEVHNSSVDLLQLLEAENVDERTAVAALALSAGRLLSPKRPMEMENEIGFIQEFLNWAGLYFHEGTVN